jgi:hypothetical protein
VADGATVPIYYESRVAKLGLLEGVLPKIDEEFDEITEGEEEDKKQRLKSKWAALEALVGRGKVAVQFDSASGGVTAQGYNLSFAQGVSVSGLSAQAYTTALNGSVIAGEVRVSARTTALASGAQARGTTQVIDLHDESIQGRFELAFTDNGIRYQSGPIAFNASAQVLRQALLDAVGSGASFASRGGDASVSFIGATGNQQWQVSFGGAALGRHVAVMDGTITQIQRAPQAQLLKLADGATTSAIQRLTAPPAGQWFVLSHAGQTTAALPAGAFHATVVSAAIR